MVFDPNQKLTQEAASKLYEGTRDNDPLPDIAPALLNSADIEAYVHKTAMINPYDRENLKSATYEASVGKWAIFWDAGGKRQVVDLEAILKKDDPIVLKPNGLVYVSTYERFHLPSYMAVRFNLRINIVHSGLLLGTGPLVDPGFEGHLLIPLHNLTVNEFQIRYKDKLIWIEFTKVSPHENWNELPTKKDEIIQARGGNFRYKPFPDRKRQVPGESVEDYMVEYLGGVVVKGPLMNVVPDEIRKAKELAKTAVGAAKSAKDTVTRIKNWGFWAAFLAIVAIVLGLVPLIYSYNDLTLQATSVINETRTGLAQHQERMRSFEEQLAALAPENQELAKVEIELAELIRKYEELKIRLEELQSSTEKSEAPE